MERIKRGEMTRELLLLPPAITTNELNEDVPSYPEANGIKVWAKAQINQGREFWAAKQLKPELSGIVWIDFQTDIKETWRIKDAQSEVVFDVFGPPVDYMMEGRTLELHLKQVV